MSVCLSVCSEPRPQLHTLRDRFVKDVGYASIMMLIIIQRMMSRCNLAHVNFFMRKPCAAKPELQPRQRQHLWVSGGSRALEALSIFYSYVSTRPSQANPAGRIFRGTEKNTYSILFQISPSFIRESVSEISLNFKIMIITRLLCF